MLGRRMNTVDPQNCGHLSYTETESGTPSSSVTADDHRSGDQALPSAGFYRLYATEVTVEPVQDNTLADGFDPGSRAEFDSVTWTRIGSEIPPR